MRLLTAGLSAIDQSHSLNIYSLSKIQPQKAQNPLGTRLCGFRNLVGTSRLELLTPTMSRWCSNQLSYAPKSSVSTEEVRIIRKPLATDNRLVKQLPKKPSDLFTRGQVIGLVCKAYPTIGVWHMFATLKTLVAPLILLRRNINKPLHRRIHCCS